MSRRPATPANCPVCGAAVPSGAKSCRECGADERSGWDEEATRYDGLDLPEAAFDSNDTSRDEGSKPQRRSKGISVVWWLVGVMLLAVMVKLALGF